MMEAKIKQIYSPCLASRRRGLVPMPGAENRPRPPTSDLRPSALDTNNLTRHF